MFQKLLIANRGEIACRVISAARRLAIRSVAVFSEADAKARHVEMADEAVFIGPAPAKESYLKIEAILEAAKCTGAQAIHPGYGFLSENPEFVEAVEAEGLVFVGPPASSIRQMGLKDGAKKIMQRAGVPIVPGYHGDIQTEDFLAEQAADIGYPVLIKARAGGGGKGMRLARSAGQFKEALAAARREAETVTGDGRCIIEKYICAPRHIEVQIFADKHGKAIHMFERDCSLQRRHQKVLEEAPAPGMSAEIRAAMGAAAIKAAQAVGYVGAGTVEFIADSSGPLRPDGFWFIEMNTRLQVEHPVTEAITGLDLVALQLQIAAGEKLPVSQSDLIMKGHAFEARLYAEDVSRGFLPATGRLHHFVTGPATRFEQGPVRIDAGIGNGDSITPYYDPMIAKIITHDKTRPAALQRMADALAQIEIAGTVTNLDFLRSLTGHEDVKRGDLETGLIDREFETLTAATPPSDEETALAALIFLALFDCQSKADPWHGVDGWRLWSSAECPVNLESRGNLYKRTVTIDSKNEFTVKGGSSLVTLVLMGRERINNAYVRLHIRSGDRMLKCSFYRRTSEVTIFLDGRTRHFVIPKPPALIDEAMSAGQTVQAPMPGIVQTIHVGAGEAVEKGQALLTLMAMKMEHILVAERSGKIEEIQVAAGDSVEEGAILITLATGDGDNDGDDDG